MDYNSSIRWVFGLIENRPKGKSVRRMAKLMKALGNPEKRFPSILIGGTSGKGSTCAILASILREAGYKTGLSTKPHFYDIRERIRVNGKVIQRKKFAELSTIVKKTCESKNMRITYFEAVKAIAFLHFARADIAIVEVGMGGRWDSTNVLEPLVSIVTNVNLEHTHILGKTKRGIAGVKAGIIKSGGVFITSEKDDDVLSVFRKECKKAGSAFIVSKRVYGKNGIVRIKLGGKVVKSTFALLGEYQLPNLACALEATGQLCSRGFAISDGSIKRGLASVRWPGRLEVMQKNPMVILDCAKEPHAAKALSAVVRKIGHRVICVLSISDDKDIEKIVENLSDVDFFVVSRHGVGRRAADPMKLAEVAWRMGKGAIIIEGVREAVREAVHLAGKRDIVIVTGSVFTVGEARRIWKNDLNYI